MDLMCCKQPEPFKSNNWVDVRFTIFRPVRTPPQRWWIALKIYYEPARWWKFFFSSFLADKQKFINFEHLEEEISKIERRRDNGITWRGQCSETVNFQAPLKAGGEKKLFPHSHLGSSRKFLVSSLFFFFAHSLDGGKCRKKSEGKENFAMFEILMD